ncbi:MAG: 3-hydroxyacyl-ACP dehydratase FabZ family protein [Planctomycetota bacterium]
MSTIPFIEPKDYPLDKVFMTAEECMERNPQRFEFLQLSSILHLDLPGNMIVGSRVLEVGEFWERGHLPGRPLFPGVLQVECMAQIASIHAHYELKLEKGVFMGFGALEGVRFRHPVESGTKLWVAGRIQKASKRRPYFKWEGQMIREDGVMVSQATITGVSL